MHCRGMLPRPQSVNRRVSRSGQIKSVPPAHCTSSGDNHVRSALNSPRQSTPLAGIVSKSSRAIGGKSGRYSDVSSGITAAAPVRSAGVGRRGSLTPMSGGGGSSPGTQTDQPPCHHIHS
jgi:hypothetical protein